MQQIRTAVDSDFDQLWPIFRDVVSRGDTYGYEVDTDKSTAFQLWMRHPRQTYVMEERIAGGEPTILATYYIKTNQAGPGKHVCNCGYMVSSNARGRGLATAMCEHSQIQAKELGYQAMQFNFVATTNKSAIHLWLKLGFSEVGRLPNAFNHPHFGLVDALVMYKTLT